MILRKLFIFAIMVSLCLLAVPAEATPTTLPIGVVDHLYLINSHPDTPKANEALRAEQEQAKKEFDAKAPSLSEKEKLEFDRQLAQRVELKRQELLKPITESINAAMRAVAEAKGLAMVLHKNTVALGGVDITEDVLKKITDK